MTRHHHRLHESLELRHAKRGLNVQMYIRTAMVQASLHDCDGSFVPSLFSHAIYSLRRRLDAVNG